MTSNASVIAQLRAHPASKRMSAEGILPLPEDDPHPELTLALYALWASLRESVTFTGQGQPSLAPCFPSQTPLQILSSLRPVLVSRSIPPSFSRLSKRLTYGSFLLFIGCLL
jgi:hypothetical protein